jgi:group I intron endonuclease
MTIYLIRNKLNGKLYIGQTERSIDERWSRDLHYARGNHLPLYRAIKKYGVENFEVLQIAVADDQAQADRLEQAFIMAAGTMAPRGYNLTRGGKHGAWGHPLSEQAKAKLRAYRLGRKASPETRKKIGDVQRGEKNHNFGKKHTPEQREKLRQAALRQWAKPF